MPWRRKWQPTPVFLPEKFHGQRSMAGYSPWGRRDGHNWASELEKEMATHSSVLAWRIPGMAEPGGLPSMGSHRVGHDWSDLAAEHLNNKHDCKEFTYSFFAPVQWKHSSDVLELRWHRLHEWLDLWVLQLLACIRINCCSKGANEIA